MEPIPFSPRAARESAYVSVDLGDGRCLPRCRRLDIPSMFLEGLVPSPLLAAAEKLIQYPDLTVADRLKLAQDEVDDAQVITALRAHAVAVVIEPVVVAEDDHVPDHMPVELFTAAQLFAIWNQTVVHPKVSAAQAAEFRRQARRHPPPVVSDRQDVRSAAVELADPDFRSG